MSATQTTVTSTQVAVRYRRNVGRLSIDMSADCRTTTLGRHIDRHIGRESAEISADISVDMSVNMSTDTSGPIYLDRYIGRVSVDISVEHRSICRPIYRSRGAQNTHGPTFESCFW